MGKKKVKSKRKSELRIIFFIILVAAVLFIVSTYAWFTTQRNVSITNLTGLVEVAEGLEISLDALNWSNEIVLGENMNIIDNAYPDHRNISPKELLPVSTLGRVSTAKQTDLKMIRGKVTNSIILSDMAVMNESLATPDVEEHNTAHSQYPGYFAFDIFLKNSSKQYKNDDVLQLNYDSSLKIIEDGNDTVGLQNTVRVALAKFGTGEVTAGNTDTGKDIVRSGVADVMAGQNDVLEQTGAGGTNPNDVYISDVAMWEPNSSDHVEYIVTNNNKIRWHADDEKAIFGLSSPTQYHNTKFTTTTQMPTFALKESSLTEGTVIANIYNWDSQDATGNDALPDDVNDDIFSGHVEKQIVLQTTNEVGADGKIDYTIAEGVQDLFSTTSKDVPFSIAPNSIVRLRVYVWLEGQDVDCINYASHGGGITLNLGLVKGSKIGADESSVQE